VLATEGPAALHRATHLPRPPGVSTMKRLIRASGGKDGRWSSISSCEGFSRLGEAMSAGPATDDSDRRLSGCAAWPIRRFAIEHQTLYSVMFDRVVPDFQPSLEAQVLAGSTLQLLANRIERAMNAGMLRSADPRVRRRWCGPPATDLSASSSRRSARQRSSGRRCTTDAMSMIIKGLS